MVGRVVDLDPRSLVYTNVHYSIQDRVEELEYRHIKVHGEFDHAKEMFLWPRSLKSETGAGGQQHGAQVITPFHCKETR